MKKLAINGGKPIRKNFLPTSQPLITEAEIKEVTNTLKNGWLTTGPKVIEFEKKFKDYIGCKHAIAVNSGTSALHLSLILAGIGKGDEVIMTPMSWVSTANAIIHSGAKPIFVDIDKGTLNINPEKIKEAITKKTKAIMPVHMSGRACEMNRIQKIAKENNLRVIEDCAHAIETVYKGQKIGAISELNCFSFQSIKNIGCGEGGMITTNNDDYAEKAKSLRLYGIDKETWRKYHTKEFKLPQAIFAGYKYNWNDVHASIGLHQLEKINKNWKIRENIAKMYYKGLKGLPMELPKLPEKNSKHALYLFVIQLKLEELKADRNQIAKALIAENIGAAVHFYSLHLHPYYKKAFGYKENDFPVALDASKRVLSIPISPTMSPNDAEDVIDVLKNVLDYYL